MMGHFRLFSTPMARTGLGLLAALGVALTPVSVLAQVQTIDPNQAIDSDLASPSGGTTPPPPPLPTTPESSAPTAPSGATTVPASPDPNNAYQDDDVVSAAEGVFGRGAEGLASMLEKILKDRGRPNAYIAGREASGAVGVGLRYGSGTMNHKVEGQRKVYWTGPSVGFDFGGNASKVFMLVYNLYDSEEIFRRYPQAEGALYVVGGLTATYLRRGDVVLIPIRLGIGWRAGINAGYMKFSEKSRIIPF
ncbi:MAG: DUF1134 domain-containing protein [Sphingobium sp.]|nr:DUF1134 domain-containing protein [Sphingobium sp.]MBP6110770.1 DUF1134 domain-containing protein [Sphingobium sp.]MBP8671381.1 DUF1134 domain-containing protein [Sphingobium sp.]MBP9157458.1 DUF1134 domain-containing protein [Sphingobium sp.]MCC6482290.1 DUF1134 domain-containing protein [Sphingomonadaceae bacterium]